MIKRKFFVLIFLLFFTILLFSGSNNKSPDKLIAGVYLKHSIEQFDKNNYNDAYSLSDIALSFNPESSDAKLIHAVSGRKAGLIDSAINELSDSIILDKWDIYNESTARVYLSEYMYWNGNLDEAYLILAPFRKNILNNTKFAEYFIRISLGVGKKNTAIKMAQDLLQIDSYNEYAQLILAMYKPSWHENAVKILLQGDPSNSISRQVVQYLIKTNTDCSFLRDYYLNQWGVDRFYKISSLCKQKDKLVDNLILLYPDNSIVNYSELLWMYSLLDNVEDRHTVISRLNSINMTVNYDINNNGFNDTSALFQKGKIVSFSFDENNDNIADYVVVINVLPKSLKVNSGKQLTTYLYSNYPNLISVIKSNGQSNTQYQLIPYKLDLEIVRIPTDIMESIPSIGKKAVFPNNDQLSASSAKKIVTNNKDNTMTNFEMIDLDESVEKVINSDGMKILEKHFNNSVLIRAYKDSDNDGAFDTIFTYTDGVLQSIAFDENNNNIYEYIQNFEDGSVRSWDFNEDGIIDSRERIQDGTLIREMSSKFDGLFDTVINIDSEKD